MSPEELDSYDSEVYVNLKGQGIKSKEDVAHFLAKEVNIRDPLGGPQYRFWFVEDYSETESLVMFKCHHAMADGIALILMFINF